MCQDCQHFQGFLKVFLFFLDPRVVVVIWSWHWSVTNAICSVQPHAILDGRFFHSSGVHWFFPSILNALPWGISFSSNVLTGGACVRKEFFFSWVSWWENRELMNGLSADPAASSDACASHAWAIWFGSCNTALIPAQVVWFWWVITCSCGILFSCPAQKINIPMNWLPLKKTNFWLANWFIPCKDALKAKN